MEILKIIKVIHVASLMLWLGSLFVVLASLALWKASRDVVQKISWTLDLPAMGIAIATGITMLFLQEQPAFKAGWFHMKMTAALLLIGVDCAARRIPSRKMAFWLLGALLLCLVMALSSIYLLKR